MTAFENYRDYVLKEYSDLPQGYYINIFIVRKTVSGAIFRTEGSGEELVKETVSAGIENPDPIRRVVISKRKQTAVERRQGREFLNRHELLQKNKDGKTCMLNTNAPCEQCVDCFLYGFAAGGGGAQKSRVLTDESYSLDRSPRSPQNAHLTQPMIPARCAIQKVERQAGASIKMNLYGHKRTFWILRP